jgi:plastocyanin
MSRRSILALGCAAALAIAACTGSGGSSGAPASSSSASDGGGGRYGYDDPASAAASAPASAAANGACSATTDAATIDVGMDGRAFTSTSIAAKVGDVIAFTNSDAVPHTATLDDDSCTTEQLGKGDTGALTFSAAGTYPFHCKIHPDMTGTFEITS